MTFSAEVFSHLDVARGGIDAVSADLVASESFGNLVPHWFGLLYDVIRATTPVLTRAVECLEDRTDDLSVALRDFYLLKLTEERGHDEMLVGDLERLGVTRADLARRIPSAPVTAMIGSQYYLIDYVHPAAYLGYMALIEGYPAKIDQLDALIERSGTPREAWTCYLMHAEVDTWHRQELEEMLDRMPDDETVRKVIVSNGIRTADFYCQALDQLLERARSAAVAA